MVSEEYLRNQREYVCKEMANIKNINVFDFNYVPDEPIERPEMDAIVRTILRYEHAGIPTHMFVFGSRGSGKTMTMKHLKRLFREHSAAKILYVNVRENNTSFKILAHLLEVTPRGYSVDELFRRFRHQYPPPAVLVLDEVDFFSEKDPGKEILYLVSRCKENYALIMLANSSRFMQTIDVRTRSSLNLVPLLFKSYDAVQIGKILHQRARQGLKKCSDTLIQKIAALVTRNANADVRLAIKTLYHAATDQTKNLNDHFNAACRDLTREVIGDLNENNKLALKAIVASETGMAKDVYRHYEQLCKKEKEHHFSYVHFSHNLSYLQSLGLILVSSIRRGKVYINQIELTCEHSLIL